MDRSAEFDLIRELRTAIAGVSSAVSDSTKSDYAKKYARMIRLKKLPESMARSSGGYYAYRAAFLYGTAHAAREAMKQRDKHPHGSEEWQAAMQNIRVCLTRLQRYPPDPKRQRCGEGEHQHMTWADVRATMNEPPVRRSKQAMLSYLAQKPHWRAQLFEKVPDRYKLAAAITALTGCRPSELVMGVRIQMQADCLVCVISGTKVSEQSGQPIRVLKLSPDSVEARFLADYCKDGEATIKIRSAKAFCESLAAAGRRAFPRARQRISPYVLRHHFSATVKSQLGREDVAACLGHICTRTQENYAGAVRGGGRSAVVGVHAAREVRHTHRDPALRFPHHSHAVAPRLG